MKLVDTCGCFPTGKHYPGIAHLIQVHAAGVADDFAADGEWMDARIAFIDTETTGIDARNDRIIELGLVIGERGVVRERRSWLLDPGVPIPKESSDVHGITDADVAGKPRFADVAAEMVASFGGALPAAYNAEFDRAFLHAEIERCGYDPTTGGTETIAPPAVRAQVVWIDPLPFAREFFRGKGESRALGAVAERLGVALERAHRATDDAEAALKVLYALATDPRMPRAYAALIREQRRLDRGQEEARRFWKQR